MEEISSVYNLSQDVVRKYIQFGEVFNLLHGGVSYLRVWQRGYGAAGVSAKYGKRSFARYPIFWGLPKIDSLPNPDPTDTADWNNELPSMEDTKVDPEAEAGRADLKRQAQEWAGLEINPEAELFVFVGRWSMQKGIDLIADIFPAVLDEYPATQLVCVGPVIDLYGRFAALKLSKLMELYPGRVFSKPEFTALPPFIFSGAEFALIPSRDEPFGLVAVEFGRKGALGVGARVGGLGNMPGWWFTVESTTTKHLLRQFKAAIKAALASKQSSRARMRARSALQRFPVAHWKELLATMHETAIKVNQKAAIKNGLELRGEYNTSLPSSALPSSNTSEVLTPPQSLISGEDAVIEEDEDIGDLPEGTLSPLDEGSPTGKSRKLSLGVRTGPGAIVPSKASKPRIQRMTHRKSFGENRASVSPRTSSNPEKRRTYISHNSVSSGSSRSASPIQKQSKKRDTLVRMSITKAFARFRFGEPALDRRSGPRLTGDSVPDEKAAKDGQLSIQSDREEVLVTAEQARADKKKSMIALQMDKGSFRKSSETIQPQISSQHHKPSVAQQPSDAYLALIGKTREDGNSFRRGSRPASILTSAPPFTPTQMAPVTPEFTASPVQASPHPSDPRTPVTPEFPAASVARDFAVNSPAVASTQARMTTTFETRRGTITFGSSGGVTSIEHPVVDSHRFSYGTVLQGKKDYALQNVEPFFTDPTGLYYKAFNAELNDLNSKNSEDALCIEEYLTMSEKDWYNRLHKVKMGKRASRARPATIFNAPLRRQGSVVSIFNENVEAAAVPDNSAEQYLLKEQYQPPSGLKKLLLRRARDWPFYSFLLAFGQIIAANSYQVTLISGQVGQSANKLYAIAAVYLVTSLLWWWLFRRLKAIWVLSLPFGFYGLAFLLLGIAPYTAGTSRTWVQNVATGLYSTASSSGAFYFSLNFGSEGEIIPIARGPRRIADSA
ncbi:MAG: hypothetical protein Q9224_005123 [Gallowayella concinna]